ncbi:MAG: hypothetical protein IKO32_06515 [Lachnospiraceae bacterium]|nr:hypothetical protein [Lachnospiraceae bacterium]
MKKRKVFFIAAFLILILLLTACASSSDPIIGRWRCGQEYKIFNEDGTYEEGLLDKSASASGTYTLHGSTLVTTIFGEDVEYIVAFPKKNQMQLSSDSGMMNYTVLWQRY